MENSLVITGIGSRRTPQHICYIFSEIGKQCLKQDWFVRSGHAAGADYAFELGAKENCIVYLPWKDFNKNSPLWGTPHVEPFRKEVFEIVCKYEPYAENLMPQIQLLKSRNVYQVLGVNLDIPSDLVVCWTPNGEITGGTGLAIKIALDHDIPILNLGDPNIPKDFDSVFRKVCGYDIG